MEIIGAGEEAITLPTELMLAHQINPFPDLPLAPARAAVLKQSRNHL